MVLFYLLSIFFLPDWELYYELFQQSTEGILNCALTDFGFSKNQLDWSIVTWFIVITLEMLQALMPVRVLLEREVHQLHGWDESWCRRWVITKEMSHIPNRLLGEIESSFDYPSWRKHGAAGISTIRISDIHRVGGKEAPSRGDATACMFAGS